MFCIWLMDLAGFARISGNPLPESVQLYIEKHPEAVICGEVQQYQATEYSLSAYLKHVCLIVGSEQIPIKNLRVFLKSNKEFPIGTTVKISGNWKILTATVLSWKMLMEIMCGKPETRIQKNRFCARASGIICADQNCA